MEGFPLNPRCGHQPVLRILSPVEWADGEEGPGDWTLPPYLLSRPPEPPGTSSLGGPSTNLLYSPGQVNPRMSPGERGGLGRGTPPTPAGLMQMQNDSRPLPI